MILTVKYRIIITIVKYINPIIIISCFNLSVTTTRAVSHTSNSIHHSTPRLLLSLPIMNSLFEHMLYINKLLSFFCCKFLKLYTLEATDRRRFQSAGSPFLCFKIFHIISESRTKRYD